MKPSIACCAVVVAGLLIGAVGAGKFASTSVKVDGKTVKINYPVLALDSADGERFADTPDGQVFGYTTGRAVKLTTPVDLEFNGALIKAGNAAENYPGVYSVWLRKREDAWVLVFNSEPDIWGSQHRDETDVAEVTLYPRNVSESRNEWQFTLRDDASALEIAWGTTVWSAPFRVGG